MIDITSLDKVPDTITDEKSFTRRERDEQLPNAFILNGFGVITSPKREISSCLFTAGQFLLGVKPKGKIQSQLIAP